MNHPKAEAARKAVERMEQERVMVHGVEVKPGQVWACGVGSPSRVVSVNRTDTRTTLRVCEVNDPDDWAEWSPDAFGRMHAGLAVDAAKPEEPSSDRGARWTDAEWAAEQVALARRQADAARAEAREARGEASEAWAVLTGRDWMEAGAAGSCVTEARRVVAERDKLRADLDHLRVGTIDHEDGRDALSRRVDDLLAQLVTARAATDSVAKAHRAVGDELRAHRDQWRNLRVELGVPDGEGIAKHVNWKLTQRDVALANAEERAERAADALAEAERDRDETRAALEAARAAVPSPVGSDPGYPIPERCGVCPVDDVCEQSSITTGPPPDRCPFRLHNIALGEVRRTRSVMDDRLGGTDPGTRTRALPVVPATCGECGHLGNAIPGPGHRCTRAGKDVVAAYIATPAHWCPVRVDRAELAKAGGA